MEIKVFNYNTEEYKKALTLRNEILRKPLGLVFTEEELKKDEFDIHVGLFDEYQVIACLSLTICENNKLKMRQVAVDLAFQGKGLGKKIAIASEELAESKGFKVIFCHARKSAVPFYKQLGYKIISEEFMEVNIPHFVMEKHL